MPGFYFEVVGDFVGLCCINPFRNEVFQTPDVVMSWPTSGAYLAIENRCATIDLGDSPLKRPGRHFLTQSLEVIHLRLHQ